MLLTRVLCIRLPGTAPLDNEIETFLLDLKTALHEGTITETEGFARERNFLDQIFTKYGPMGTTFVQAHT